MSNRLERKGIKPINDPEFSAWMKRMQEDAGWFLTQPEHLERYQGMVVVLHNRVVVGSGRNDIEAMENVRQRAREQQQEVPPCNELLAVPMPLRAWLDDDFCLPSPDGTGNGEAPASTGS